MASSGTVDIIIIGGGVVGTLIARELSKYECSVTLLEKENDVSSGTSKANSGIVHAGFDATYGTAKAKFNVLGNTLMENVCSELGVKFKKNGSMVLAFDKEQQEEQKNLYEQGKRNGVKELFIISGDEARKIEPSISSDVLSVLLAKTGGIVCPYTLATNAARSAELNGVNIHRNCGVTKINIINTEHIGKENKHFCVSTDKKEFFGKYIINAAGVHADDIASLAGDNSFSIYPRRGEYMLFDKSLGSLISHTIFQMPDKQLGKGILVTPTVDGNLLIGPNAHNMDKNKKFSDETTYIGQQEILIGARKSVPDILENSISLKSLITSFAGLRAVSDTDDFIIKCSDTVKNMIHVAGMQSPGLTASPAIAEYVASMIGKMEGGLKKKADFIPIIKPEPNILTLSHDELESLIASNPAYGNIICRCETISEGQIVDSINCECGATDIDGVKRRTRAGMGRCQGGFCMPRVLEIIARETNVKYTAVTKKGNDSIVLVNRKG